MSVFLAGVLDAVGIPVARTEFKQPQAPPFLVYVFTHSNTFYADSVAYAKSEHYQVELYTEKKDIALEERIEGIFESNGIYHSKTEQFLEEEGLLQILYEIQLFGGST